MENLFFENPLSPAQLRQRREPRPDEDRDLRGPYFRDTTAVLHSSPFRRMKHKTQVFFAPKNDHICTRIEHVMHVSTIAATICRALNLDSDLAWAIGMGHDLGHTPFGHLGETILAKLRGVEGFRHEMYSLHVVDHLTNHGKGLNLTHAVRDGIVNHCGEKFEQAMEPDFSIKDLNAIVDRSEYPCTWEGTVVRMSDKIAYLGRDLEDALRLGVVDHTQVPASPARVLGSSNSEIIDTLVTDVIHTSNATGKIALSDPVYEAFLEMKEFNYRHIYRSKVLEDLHPGFERVLTTLYEYLSDLFASHGFDSEGYTAEANNLARGFSRYAATMADYYHTEPDPRANVVFDFIAGMSDDYALDSLNEIMVPQSYTVGFSKR
ncbi:HD domain-containing protein [Spirochaeta africana]|uniref:dGTP triphosphohydrolase n=1 Tax=Spirochaeta africana (strain ATCC 700263 / DSM 8902 / Z-7692) TaxID=889378 RepID=H9ULQ2_SPIAZ|nr:HD domain-containing protein [Spirochaeta africana]AFG38445.1 dGTP triphosphohydrolase [Spirochaeta africana DSM 8902]